MSLLRLFFALFLLHLYDCRYVQQASIKTVKILPGNLKEVVELSEHDDGHGKKFYTERLQFSHNNVLQSSCVYKYEKVRGVPGRKLVYKKCNKGRKPPPGYYMNRQQVYDRFFNSY